MGDKAYEGSGACPISEGSGDPAAGVCGSMSEAQDTLDCAFLSLRKQENSQRPGWVWEAARSLHLGIK